MTSADAPVPPGPETPPAAGRLPTIVALVCSAGGLSALQTVLGGLAADFPAAVIVLQHQRPDQPSRLAWLLGRRCALPVADAADGAPPVAGTVVVIPPGRDLVVTAEPRLALVNTDGPPPYRPSADLLLASLAGAASRRGIAVMLSEAGRDGATGATALHDVGGIVIASAEASSAPDLPEAAVTRGEVVDYTLPVGQIAPLLEELASAASEATGGADT